MTSGARSALPPVVFAGRDFWPAVLDSGLSIGIGLELIPVVHIIGWPVWWLLLAAAVAAALGTGARYRLTISSEGIELLLVRGCFLRVRQQHWPLDAEVQLYEAWEADAPEALFVHADRNSGAKSSEPFGSAREQVLRPLHARIDEALRRQRAAALTDQRRGS